MELVHRFADAPYGLGNNGLICRVHSRPKYLLQMSISLLLVAQMLWLPAFVIFLRGAGDH